MCDNNETSWIHEIPVFIQTFCIANFWLCIRFRALRESWVFSFSSSHLRENSGCSSSFESTNFSQSSSIVELRFSFCSFMFLSILSSFTNFRPVFWSYMIKSGSCLSFCHSPPKLDMSCSSFSFSGVNFVNPLLECAKCLLKTFPQSSIRLE